MDIFYIVVSSIAIIVLILILTVIGLMMKYQNHVDVYPPFQSQCPDYWTVNANGTCSQPNAPQNIKPLNGLPTTYNASNDIYKSNIVTSGPSNNLAFDFSGNTLCDNNRWAKKYLIEWDGVSNSIAKC